MALLAASPEGEAARRRPDADRGDEDAAGQSVGPDRHLGHQGAGAISAWARTRSPSARRRRIVVIATSSELKKAIPALAHTASVIVAILPCATRARWAARWRTTRPGGRLSGHAGARPRRHDHDQPARHRRRRFLPGDVHDRTRRRRDRHRNLKFLDPAKGRPTRNSATRRRAMRWRACSRRSSRTAARARPGRAGRGPLRVPRAADGSGAGRKPTPRRGREYRGERRRSQRSDIHGSARNTARTS